VKYYSSCLWGIISVSAVSALGVARANAQTSITFTADFMSADQPRVAWILEDPNNPGDEGAIGPELLPYAVLDTGANGIVLGDGAYLTLAGYNYNRYQRAVRPGTGEYVQYEEIGVAGSQLIDLLAPYHLNIGSKSSTQMGQAAFAIDNANILGAVIRNDNGTAIGAADFGSFSAIIGMPAMIGRVTEIDLRVTAGDFIPGNSIPDFDYLMADFHTALPAVTANSLHVDLMPLILPPSTGGSQHPDDPKPTFADVPLLSVTANRHVNGTTLSQTRNLLLDTGAQTTILSTTMVTAMGYDLDPESSTNDIVDLNGDGKIDDADYLPVGGLGGTSLMPLILVSELVLPTQEGIDIIAKNVVVGVLDIGGEGEDALLDGVLGMNILDSGYLDLIFAGNGEYGRFTHIYFDFTTEGAWAMRLEVNPNYVDAVPEPATMGLVFLGGLGLLKRRRRRA
jgi:hypothetical protein